jgi:hypothetical protein
MIEQALVAHCTTYPALQALIGDRFEPLQKAQGSTLPAIGYGRAGVRPSQHRSSRRANYGRTRFQFDVWGATYLEVIQTRSAFKNAMAAFAQDSNPRVDVALLQDDRDAYEAEPGKWRAIVDYHIYHTEA